MEELETIKTSTGLIIGGVSHDDIEFAKPGKRTNRTSVMRRVLTALTGLAIASACLLGAGPAQAANHDQTSPVQVAGKDWERRQ